MAKALATIVLDYKEFSESAYEQVKEAITKLGFHIGDILEEYSGEKNGCDMYVLYISKKKLNKKELKENFPTLLEGK